MKKQERYIELIKKMRSLDPSPYNTKEIKEYNDIIRELNENLGYHMYVELPFEEGRE